VRLQEIEEFLRPLSEAKGAEPVNLVLGLSAGFLAFALAVLTIVSAVVGPYVGVIILWQYLRTVGRLLLGRLKFPPDAPQQEEPAYLQYFFSKAFHDYLFIVKTTLVKTATTLMARAREEAGLNGRAIGCTILCSGFLGIAIGMIPAAVVSLVHMSIVLACYATALGLAYLLRSIEYLGMAWRRAFFACPHAGCYVRIALPVYLCPQCGAQHRKLIPGPYGTFFRRCRCNRRLPTLFLLGRSSLPSLCPNPGCLRPLHDQQGLLRNLHVAVVGGATAGKSSLLAATLVELSRHAARGEIGLSFPSPRDERLYASCLDAFSRGILPAKTPELSPNAFEVKLTAGTSQPILLNLYDAAGELYQGTDVLRGHTYYSYLHGVFLLIDPLSLPEARAILGAAQPQVMHSVQPSHEPPESVYGRMLEALRGFRGTAAGLDVPLAVVLTKGDALVGSALASSAADRPSQAVATRHWLIEHGAGNLVRLLEGDFKKISYFTVSALGRVPDSFNQQPFHSWGSTAPLDWVLNMNGIRFPYDLETTVKK
jgi:hypothetical protein